MIVCHCNTLTDAVIRQAVDQLLDEDPHRMMTPNLVYRRLGQRGRCCGCFPLAIDVINAHIEKRLATDDLAERRQQIVEQQRAYRDKMPTRRRVAADA